MSLTFAFSALIFGANYLIQRFYADIGPLLLEHVPLLPPLYHMLFYIAVLLLFRQLPAITPKINPCCGVFVMPPEIALWGMAPMIPKPCTLKDDGPDVRRISRGVG